MAGAYFGNDDDDRYNDEGMFMPDIGAMNRAEIFLDDMNYNNRMVGNRDNNNDMKDVRQKFRVFVNIVANAMVDQRVVSLSKNDIGFILSQTDMVSLPEYKNPTGFVLGYWVGKDGEIDKQALARLEPNLSKLEYPIKLYDVIRYARLWIISLL